MKSAQMKSGDPTRLPLDAALEQAGPRDEAAGRRRRPDALLLRGAEARLHRELHREQLDVWIQSRSRVEFVFEPPPVSSFRRVALSCCTLRCSSSCRSSSAPRCDPISSASRPRFAHGRRFCAQLLSHMCRRPLMQANVLHALRNECAEKAALLLLTSHFLRCTLHILRLTPYLVQGWREGGLLFRLPHSSSALAGNPGGDRLSAMAGHAAGE